MAVLDVYRLSPRVIPLNIKKQYVNVFLGGLWDVFRATIGPVTCQHGYGGTADSQVYNYRVRWVTSEFEAVLNFYNHTSQGLKFLELRLIDREANTPFGVHAEKIAHSVQAALDRLNVSEHGIPAFDCYAKARILCGAAWSGNYYIDNLGVLLLDSPHGYELVYPAHHRGAKSEFNYEARKDAVRYVSALTVLSQELFLISETDEVDAISPEQFDDLVKSTEFSGKYIDDTPLFGLHGAKLGMPSGPDGIADMREVIMMERKDFRVDGWLCLPVRVGELIEHINGDLKRRQASKRFHDALRFREIHERYSDGDFSVSYELVAYVAAIEALLDHSKVESTVSCNHCGKASRTEDYKISQKFNDFVSVHGGGGEVMSRKFKELYGHRSKFVHTGLELHVSHVLRPNRPLILEGKNHIAGVPDYYYNIHEWTGFLLRVYFYLTAYQVAQSESDSF